MPQSLIATYRFWTFLVHVLSNDFLVPRKLRNTRKLLHTGKIV